MRVATKIQLGLAATFAVVTLALRGPIQDGLLEGNETLYWVFFSAVLFYAASYFARGYLAGHRRFGLFTALILSESVFRTLFAVLVAVGLLSGQSAVAIGIVAAPALSLLVVPVAFARRQRRHEAAPASARGSRGRTLRSGVHPRPRHRLRRRRAADHVQRAGLPQRRAADRPRPGGRRGGRLHLQRADDRPRAAAALPGGLDQHPPPPDQPPHLGRSRQRGGVPPLGADGAGGDRRLHGRGGARLPDRRPAADAARLQQKVQVRPGRAAPGHRRHGPLPLLGDDQPGLPRPGTGAARLGALDRLRGLLRRLVLPAADRRRVPPGRGRLRPHRRAAAEHCSSSSTVARTSVPRTCRRSAPPRSWRRGWRRSTRAPRVPGWEATPS